MNNSEETHQLIGGKKTKSSVLKRSKVVASKGVKKRSKVVASKGVKKSAKKNNLTEYNKKLDDAIKKNSKDKKIKNMKDVRELAKKEFAKISKEKRKGKGVALKLYNNEVDKVLKNKVGVNDRKALHALVKKK
jgi:hypothetical protein|tara:strand:+ start:744 stop:1142 length:399 start_codon:yes stop_codon:yes gene_type:complete